MGGPRYGEGYGGGFSDPARYFGGGGDFEDDGGYDEYAAAEEPAGRRSSRRRRRGRRTVLGPLAGAAALALLLGISAYAFASAGAACSGEDAITLDVAVAPGIDPAVTNAARRFSTGVTDGEGAWPAAGTGSCIRAVVRKADPVAMSALLAGRAVPDRTTARRPDVWIPDSSLWVSLAEATAAEIRKDTDRASGAPGIEVTRTSVARSPVVVALPRTLAASLRTRGVPANPSWNDLLNAAGATQGGAARRAAQRNVIPPGSARLLVPEPARNAAGMHALMITDALLADDPDKNENFAGVVRTVRESALPNVQAQFARFRPARTGRRPMALASERDVWAYNRTRPAEPAVALYPREGTLSLDHPYTITTPDWERRTAARRLERAMSSDATRREVHELGYRSPDGAPPPTFNAAGGVNPARTRELPPPRPAQVGRVMQAWSRLSLGIRILTLVDISGTMAEPIAPGTTRLQATARTAQGGLSMMSNDSELGVWAFSTELRGDQDWLELVPVGRLGERIGSVTRRQKILSGLGSIRPKVGGDTGLFETLIAAYRQMTLSHKPEFINTVVLFTDGEGNDDPGGPTLERTLADLRALTDPDRPVQIIMIGVGRGVDTRELRQITRVVPGAVYVAESPDEIGKIFLTAMSRRVSD